MSPERYTQTGERLMPLFEHASAHGPVQAVRVDYAPGGYAARIHTVSANASDTEPPA